MEKGKVRREVALVETETRTITTWMMTQMTRTGGKLVSSPIPERPMAWG